MWADYDVRPAIVDPEDALDLDAAPIFESHGTNQAMIDTAATAVDLEGGGDIVVAVDMHNQRVAVVPLEPLAVLAQPDGAGGLDVHASTQMPARAARRAGRLCGLDPSAIRVIGP